jgi:hypothetical protein
VVLVRSTMLLGIVIPTRGMYYIFVDGDDSEDDKGDLELTLLL